MWDDEWQCKEDSPGCPCAAHVDWYQVQLCKVWTVGVNMFSTAIPLSPSCNTAVDHLSASPLASGQFPLASGRVDTAFLHPAIVSVTRWVISMTHVSTCQFWILADHLDMILEVHVLCHHKSHKNSEQHHDAFLPMFWQCQIAQLIEGWHNMAGCDCVSCNICLWQANVGCCGMETECPFPFPLPNLAINNCSILSLSSNSGIDTACEVDSWCECVVEWVIITNLIHLGMGDWGCCTVVFDFDCFISPMKSKGCALPVCNSISNTKTDMPMIHTMQPFWLGVCLPLMMPSLGYPSSVQSCQ